MEKEETSSQEANNEDITLKGLLEIVFPLLAENWTQWSDSHTSPLQSMNLDP